MQDQIYKIDMRVAGILAYGQEYAHVKWRLNIENILQQMITEIKASML